MEQRVSAILLAAGQSRRMGCCKQLLPLGDKPVIIRCLEAMIRAEIKEIVVVVNSTGDAVADAVSGYPVKVVRNEEPESDMAGSVRAGYDKIAQSSTGVIVALTDHPLVTSSTYSLLLSRHMNEPESIIIPFYEGKKGHPTLFPRSVLEELKKPLTLRDLLSRYSEMGRLMPISDMGVLMDMDTMEDYEKVKRITVHGRY